MEGPSPQPHLTHPLGPETPCCPRGAPLRSTRTQSLSNIGSLCPEPSNSGEPPPQPIPAGLVLTRLTNQRRRLKEVSRAFEDDSLNSNSSA